MKLNFNWRRLFIKKDINPDRDWRWLLSVWLVAVLAILMAGILAYPVLFNVPVAAVGGSTTSSTTPTIGRSDVEKVMKMIEERAATAATLQTAPPNLVDPSQ